MDDSGLVPNADDEQTVCLVPRFEEDDEAERILRSAYAEVFERELFGRNTDESAWPKNRTFGMFKKWFQVELHSIVEDLCIYELVDDEA